MHFISRIKSVVWDTTRCTPEPLYSSMGIVGVDDVPPTVYDHVVGQTRTRNTNAFHLIIVRTTAFYSRQVRHVDYPD
jgi:hypothetical protein